MQTFNVLFADDTKIFYYHDHLTELVNILCSELDKMYTWFCVNNLLLKIAKTNYILFGNYRCERHVALRINDVNIERVEAKLAKVASVIYKVSHYIDKSSRYTLYCSLFLPYMM